MTNLHSRIFDRVESVPPDAPVFHLFPNQLTTGGATELHEHIHDHLAIFDCSGGASYLIKAILPDGQEVSVETKDSAGLGVWALIKAGVKHRISLAKGDKGSFCCIFSHFDHNGRFSFDPKVS